MKLQQPVVIKVQFATAESAAEAVKALGDTGIFGYAEMMPPRVVFTAPTANIAIATIKRMNWKGQASIFNPSIKPDEGWPEFSQLTY